MSLPGAKSLRHIKAAFAFTEEIRYDLRVFIAFYEVARRRFYLEGLNFFLVVVLLNFS